MFFVPPIVFAAAATVGYTGPGDVIAGALGWWGLRAYTSASIGANAVRLRESGGNTEQDFVTIAGGGLDLAAIATFKGANNLFVVKLYDQTGNASHLAQATAANQPGLTLSGLGALPIMTFDGTDFFLTSGTYTQAQPLTMSLVGNDTGATATAGFLSSSAAGEAETFFRQAPNTFGLYAGSGIVNATATDATWYAIQAIFNGASSVVYANGASTNVGNPGAAGLINTITMGQEGFGSKMIGYGTEGGVWGSAFSAPNQASMDSNQRTYWGF